MFQLTFMKEAITNGQTWDIVPISDDPPSPVMERIKYSYSIHINQEKQKIEG